MAIANDRDGFRKGRANLCGRRSWTSQKPCQPVVGIVLGFAGSEVLGIAKDMPTGGWHSVGVRKSHANQ
ncbi:MAG: hypothetical protein RR063_02345 [Anaerovoracaceae bacterium]